MVELVLHQLHPHHGGAGEGCVVLRARVAALHRAVRE